MAAVFSGFGRWSTSVDGGLGSGGEKRITLSKHCVQRFRDRFRPGLDLAAARRELSRVIANGVLVDLPPSWCGLDLPTSRDSYLVVGDDLVLTLLELGDEFRATTCLGRGTIRPDERSRRRKRKITGRRHGSGDGRRKERRPVPYCRAAMPRLDEDLSVGL